MIELNNGVVQIGSFLTFIIVPLVCAFFVDLVNAILIPAFLARF